MELIWIPISVLAAFMQAVRTAAQKSMNEKLSVMVTTYSRSLFGLPLMLIYLLAVQSLSGAGRRAHACTACSSPIRWARQSPR